MPNPLVTYLADGELISELTRLARREQEATAQLLLHLAEFDTRRLYLHTGYASLFVYCRDVLGLSDHATYNSIEAARTGRRFPLVFELLGQGQLNLATVRLLAPHLTDANHRELLPAASRLGKREVQDLIAGRFPLPDVRPSVGELPSGASALAGAQAPGQAEASPWSPAVIAPLSAGRYEIRFTASAATREKLARAQDLLRHAVPQDDPAEIVDRALTALLEDLARKKFAAVKGTPQPHGATVLSPGSRHIPAGVKRAVWLRDTGRCAFTAKSGLRCAERGFLEFHHVVPYGRGGEATEDNIELRCRAHNAYEAELVYGPADHGAGMVREPRPHDSAWDALTGMPSYRVRATVGAPAAPGVAAFGNCLTLVNWRGRSSSPRGQLAPVALEPERGPVVRMGQAGTLQRGELGSPEGLRGVELRPQASVEARHE